jgi:hypothetical protein
LQPVVLYAERDPSGARQVAIDCCANGRQTCLNFERADYVAVDGFEVRGGRYGIRGVGQITGDSATHQKGLAVLNCEGHDQNNDPILTGQSDWVVIDGFLGYRAGAGDGHGIYLSNGSDFLIVRNVELYDNASSDFQINADPAFGCTGELGVPFDDPRCDGSALQGLGEGVSEYVLLEYSYLHHGSAQGPNFTSVRNSIVRNNLFGFYARHGFSFWQETTNPNLGSSNNLVLHNTFIATNANRQAVQFIAQSTNNRVLNNLFLGVTIGGGGAVSANPQALLMEVDGTVGGNTYQGNVYVGGRIEGRAANAGEQVIAGFDSSWFAGFGGLVTTPFLDYRPTAGAPFAGGAALQPEAPLDLAGAARRDPTTSGALER